MSNDSQKIIQEIIDLYLAQEHVDWQNGFGLGLPMTFTGRRRMRRWQRRLTGQYVSIPIRMIKSVHRTGN